MLLAPSGWKPGMHSLVPQERIIQPQMSAELRWKNPGLDRQKGTSRQATLPDCRGTLNVSHSLCLRFLPLAKRGEMVSGFRSQAIPGRESHRTLGKSFQLSKPQFSHLSNEDNHSHGLVALWNLTLR